MATVKQYAIQLWRTHKVISRKLGQDVSWGSSGSRVNAIATDLLLSGLIKILVDKGVITNAELSAMYDGIAGADIPQLPSMIIPVEDGEVPDPDLGV